MHQLQAAGAQKVPQTGDDGVRQAGDAGEEHLCASLWVMLYADVNL